MWIGKVKVNNIIEYNNTQKLPEKPVVLIIDDQSMIRLLCRKYLQHVGFNIIEAESGQQALTICQEKHPDVILLDVNMPGMDGYTVCEKLRENILYKTTPIVMLTGHDDLPSIQKAFDTGATDFVTKPVNWLILSHRLRYMIRAGFILSQLHDSQMRLGAAQRIAHIGNWEYDTETKSMYWSDEVYRILGYASDNLNPTFEALLNLIPKDEREQIRAKINKGIKNNESLTVEHHIVVGDDSKRIIQQQIQICHDPKTRHCLVIATIQDVTEQRQSEQTIRYMAHYDELTGLPNRAYFKSLMNKYLHEARNDNKLFAILFIDIDRFKKVNDSLGHDIGDLLLQSVAHRIQDCVRHVDVIAHSDDAKDRVARIGGDEFTVLLDQLRTPMDAAKTAKRIISAFAEPIVVADHELITSPSIGISIFPTDAETPEALLKNADLAMYYAKNRGRNNFVFYSEQMNTRALERFNLESSLQKALINEEFLAYFQPQVNLQDRAIHGFESLVRWRHPDLGMVLPHNFVPLAEESGLINDIGKVVLEKACYQMKAWLDAGHELKKMAVNLSPRQFLDKNLMTTFQQSLEDANLSAEYLEVEVTESIFMQNTDDIIRIMKKFKEMGMAIALDDFGTGFSSLSYLKRFPIDTLKIDKTFVKEIDTDEDNVAITQTIIAMAQCLGLDVVAEGVETEAQFEKLNELGCDIAQGYLFSRPTTAEQSENLIKMLQIRQES